MGRQQGRELGDEPQHLLGQLRLSDPPCQRALDRDVVKAAFRRYADVARDVWPNYRLHFNPHKDNTTTQPTAVKITDWWDPATWDTIGPDPYDTGCAYGELYGNGSESRSLERLGQQGEQLRSGGCRQMAGLGTRNGTPTSRQAILWRMGLLRAGEGTDPGGDNPVYMQKMFEHFGDAASSGNMGYEVYFNSPRIC